MYHVVYILKHMILNSKLFQRPFSNDMSQFKQVLRGANEVVVLTSTSISVESGIPSYRDKSNLWRQFPIAVLSSIKTFRDDPGLIWEFNHHRREMALTAKPNAGHLAIAEYEARHASDKKITVLTQNLDGLHSKAGAKHVIELHGSLFKTRCTKCNEVLADTNSPICPALQGQGSPSSEKLLSDIPVKNLPHCKKPDCGGLLRPHVVWIGEALDDAVMSLLDTVMSKCKLLLVVGNQSLTYPADSFPIVMQAGGSVVAEFNMESPPASTMFDFYFVGPSALTLPQALSD